jgi:hypothetical protein
MLRQLRALSVWVAAYLLAVTTLAPLHHHGFSCCHFDGCGGQEYTGQQHHTGQNGEMPAALHDGGMACFASDASDSSDGCLICRFLAQRTASVADSLEIASPAPEQQHVFLASDHVVARVVSCWQSRAPPSLA